MKEQKKAIHWFMDMVRSKRFDPLNPDLTLVPNDILLQMEWEESPDGKLTPKKALIDVAFYLRIECRIAEHAGKHKKAPEIVCDRVSDILKTVQCLSILVAMEKLKRAEVLTYFTTGKWYDQTGDIVVSSFKPLPPSAKRPGVPEKAIHLN